VNFQANAKREEGETGELVVKGQGVPNRILISGYIGFHNAGDEAIAEVVTEDLRREVPGAEITILSGDPAHTAAAYGVRAIGWREPLEILEAIRDTDLTIIGGGGLFQDYWGFDPRAVMTREHWGLSFYAAPALVSAVYGKPVMLYAVGVGPLLSEHGRKFTKAVADIASRVTVRDAPSKELLEALGVPAEKIQLTADPVFHLEPDESAAALPQVAGWMGAQPAIAVAVRNWYFGTDQPFLEAQIAAALDAVLAAEGGRALFVPFHCEPGAGDDVEMARRVVGRMRHADRAGVLAERSTPAQLAGIIGRAGLVLGMRLHSLIFSLGAGVPFVALEYDPKVGGLASIAGLEEFAHPVGGIDGEVLAGCMRRALREKERFREASGNRREELRCLARKNAAIAAELLHEGARVDYGPDAHALMGRMLASQVALSEALRERLTASCEALGEAPGSMNAVAMADRVARAVRELSAHGWTQAQELQAARQETEQLRGEMQETEARLAAAAGEKAVLEKRLNAPPEPGFKRAVQLFLDVLQAVTPGPLRRAARKPYLQLYFRIFPEKRPGAAEKF
jgi:polysaccharide pyruvyl transferase CsaB